MNKNIMIIDTETIGVDKKFCYNIGYVIANTCDDGSMVIIDKKEFMCKQVWYNKMLYSTAYYANKKPIYTKRIREKKIQVLPYEKIIENIMADIEDYHIEYAYAYNSPFDKDVFAFNSDWFRTINPFDELPMLDIRAFFIKGVKDNPYFKLFCDKHELYTDSGNYSTTAETAYKYITGNLNFEEEHTALADSIIEFAILADCYHCSKNIIDEPPVPRSIERKTLKRFTLVCQDYELNFDYYKKTYYKSKDKMILK